MNKNNKTKVVYPTILIVLFLCLFFYHSSSRISSFWKNYDAIIAAELNSIVLKTYGSTSGKRIYFVNGDSYLFSSKYNIEHQCWVDKCAKSGDLVFKKAGTNYLYIIKKNAKDTILIDILEPPYKRPK